MTILNPGWTFFMDKIFSFLFFFRWNAKMKSKVRQAGQLRPKTVALLHYRAPENRECLIARSTSKKERLIVG